jgi:thiosulfate dehydrogenase
MKFIIGVILGIVLVPLAGYMYFAGGSAPVATSDSDMPFESFLAHKALDARITKEMPKSVPIQANESNYVAGAELYKQNCAVCHGVPLAPKTAIANGMYPRPPQLFQGKGVTDDEVGETYWKIFNGIRLTGMPGFNKSLSETQMWQIALLLKDADKLPTSAKDALVAPISSPSMGTIQPVPPPPAFPSTMPATTPGSAPPK